MKKDVLEFVRKQLKLRLEERRNEIKKIRKRINVLFRKRLNYTIVVYIKSAWDHEGEENITTAEKNGDLFETIQKAIKEFHETNHRSDFQAQCSVRILFADGISVTLPEKFWAEHRDRVLER